MRPKSIIISPTTADPNGVMTSQDIDQYEVAPMSGALAGAGADLADPNGLVTTSQPTAAGTMAMNGALYTAAALTYFTSERYISIPSDGDDSGITFTITGTNKEDHVIQDVVTGPNTMMVASTLKFLTVTNIAISAAAAGNIIIGSLGVATFADPGHVDIVSGGTDTGVTFTVYGTDRFGRDITETITGADGTTATGSSNFATVTKVTASADTASTVEIGSANEMDSQWIPVNKYGGDISVGCTISSGASLTYAVQHTFTNMQTDGFLEADAIAFVHATVTAETTSQDGSYSTPINAVRVAITSFTSGTVTFEVVQARA